MDNRDQPDPSATDPFATGMGMDVWARSESFQNDQGPHVGEILGGYRLLELIGEGGMSWVYKAQRADASLDRIVALKLSKGVLNDQLKLRFVQEQEILSRMKHPNIGALFDVGMADFGSPFIVLEYLDAIPIDLALGTASAQQRMAWMIDLAGAVAYAHRHLVVHRDIKPTNVLVTRGSSRIKLVDFGIAKSLEANAEFTMDAAPHTPGYASPEQLLGEPITPASDVYQLGLMLHLLLVGKPVAKHLPAAELVKLIQQQAPTPLPLDSALSADFRAIVRHCLVPAAAGRYRDAQALLDDLLRVRNGYAPMASEPSALKVTWRYLARHRIASSISVLMLIAATTATIAYTRNINAAALLAQQQAALAQQQATKANRVAEFLKGIFEVTDPEHADASTTLRDMVSRSIASIEGTFADSPELAVELLLDIGTNYRAAGAMEKAEETLTLALDIAVERLSRDHDLIAECRERLGRLVGILGRFDEGQRLLRQALTQRREVLQDNLKTADTLGSLASTLQEKPEYWAEAFTLLLEAEQMYTRLGVPDSNDTLAVPFVRAQLLERMGRYDEAAALFKENLERQIKIGGRRDVRSIVLSSLSAVQFQLGELDAAKQSANAALTVLKGLHDGPSNDIAATLRNLARIEWALGQPQAAIGHMERALEHYQQVFGASSPGAANVHGFLASFESEIGSPQKAAQHLQAALGIAEELNLPILNLGLLHARAEHTRILGDAEQSHRYAMQAQELAEQMFEPDNPERIYAAVQALGLELLTAQVLELETKLGRLVQLRSVLKSAVSAKTVERLAWIDLVLSEGHLKAGNLPMALDYLNRATEFYQALRPQGWSAQRARQLRNSISA